MQELKRYNLKACDVLYHEHRTVNKMLEQVAPGLRPWAGPAEFSQGLTTLMRTLEAELPPHFAKEEEGLFPVMESVVGEAFPPIEVMKAEHRFLVEHYDALREAARALAAAPSRKEPREDALGHLTPLVGTLEDHIVKEDSVLLVMASEQLEASHDGKIMRVFDEIDRDGRRWV